MNTKKGFIPFGLGAASASMSYVLTTQLTYCLTDSYAMSAMLVGSIFLISRIFDGVTDIIAGFIIDKTHTKFGKARPFDLFAVPLWIVLILCFNVPSFSTTGKVIWVFLTYNLCQSVCYTFVTVSQTVRVRRSFGEDARSKALALAGIVSAVCSTLVGILCPTLITIFENRPYGWTIIIGCFAVPGIIMTLTQFFMLPEKNGDKVEEKIEKLTIKDSVKALFTNKYIFIVASAIILISMVNIVIVTAQNYYFKYIVGDLSLLSFVSMASLVGYFTLVLMPVFTKRLGNRNTMLVAFLLIAVFSILKYGFKVNVAGLAVCTALSGVGVTLATCMRDMLVIDCMRYGQWKSKNNYEGIYASVKGFSDKMALGIGSMAVGAILEIGGFDGGLGVQTATAERAISFCYAGFPAILGLLGVVIMICYRLESKLKELDEISA